MIRVLVWNEYLHEKQSELIAGLYPEGIHGAIANSLRQCPDLQVGTATQDQPDQGLSEAVLAETDVLVYWSHIGQGSFPDEAVDRLQQRVLQGMGLVLLHSSCISKIFQRLMGTTGDIKWREAGEKQRVWVVAPSHPIVAGLPEYFEIEHDEMYGEHFDIPAPDELVFISWFPGGEVVRSGCCFQRGQGKIFYFQPGHETYPVYHDEHVLRVIANAAHWAAPVAGPTVTRGNVQPLEPLA
jgi:trehalose utilization protein